MGLCPQKPDIWHVHDLQLTKMNAFTKFYISLFKQHTPYRCRVNHIQILWRHRHLAPKTLRIPAHLKAHRRWGRVGTGHVIGWALHYVSGMHGRTGAATIQQGANGKNGVGDEGPSHNRAKRDCGLFCLKSPYSPTER